MTNIQAKFDILKGVCTKDMVTHSNKKYQLWDLLLNVKIRKIPVFVRVEQGAGKHKDDILIMIIARMRMTAQQ